MGSADRPVAQSVCAALETGEGAAALQKPAADQACTMIFGGPQKAEITGTVDGSPVETTITRANGCEIARWDALAPVVELPA